MPSTAALDLVVSLTDGASKGLEDIGQKGGMLGDLVSKGALVAGGGILALGGFLVDAAKQANEEQVGMDRLGQTLQNNIPHWQGSEDAVEGYIAKSEGMAFADDQIRDSLGSLVAHTHDLTKAQSLQAQAMDLARFKNIDLATATNVIGKVYEGNTGVLNKYGIAVDKGTKATDALAIVQKVAGGQAQVYADSAAGSMDRLQTSMGDAVETIGHSVLNLVSGPLKGLADWVSSPAVQNGIQAAADVLGGALTQGIGYVQGAIGAIMPILQPFIDAWVNLFATIGGGGDVMGALGGLFENFGAAFANAWSIIGPALGNLWNQIIGWIQTQGPILLAQLAVWGQALWQWIQEAAPALLAQLGQLVSQVFAWIAAQAPPIVAQLQQWGQALWQWIQAAIPPLIAQLGQLASQFFGWIAAQAAPILAQLGQWAQAFIAWVVPAATQFLQQWPSVLSGFLDWIANAVPPILAQLAQWAGAFIGWILPALPGILEGLGGVVAGLLIFIGETAATILVKLAEWTGAFFAWIWNDVLPQLPGWLANIAVALWTFISENAPVLLTKLAEWRDQFFNWIMTDIVPNIPTWLGNIASALWTWVTTTAADIGTKLVTEWLPAFWTWLTGPSGVLAGIGAKLNEAWVGFTTWVSGKAAAIGGEVASIGAGIIEGIKTGILNGWEGFKSWLTGLLGGAVDAVKHFFGIGSPSKLMADEVGAPLVQGIQAGIGGAWSALQQDLGTRVQGLSGSVGIGVGGRGLGLAGAGAGGGAGAPGGPALVVQNVNVYAYPGMDSGQFATSFIQALEEELSASSRARRT
jgi:hypothetical protein